MSLLGRIFDTFRRAPHRDHPSQHEGHDMREKSTHDEQLELLRQKLTVAQVRLTVVQAEVRAMQVDAGVIQRDYTPPRRATHDEGHQPA